MALGRPRPATRTPGETAERQWEAGIALGFCAATMGGRCGHLASDTATYSDIHIGPCEGTHEAVRGTAAHAEDRERLQTTADLEAERVVRVARRRRAEAKQRGLDDFAEASASGAAARAAAAARGGGPVDGTAHARRIHAYVRAVKERDQGPDQGGAAAQLPATVRPSGKAGRGAGRDSAARAGVADSAATAGAGAGAGSSSTCRHHEAKGAQAQAYAYAKLHGEAPPETGRPSEAEARRRRHGQRLAAHEHRVGGAYEQEELRRRAAADRRVMEKAQQSLEYHQVRELCAGGGCGRRYRRSVRRWRQSTVG